MVVLEGASLGGGGTFAERRVTKIEQVQTRRKEGPNFGHFART